MLRTRLSSDLKEAMKSKDTVRLSTLRLICAAIKDRDIDARIAEGGDAETCEGCSESEIRSILARMIKQRQESARAYDEAGRPELAAQERAEITVIQGYLPKQLSEAEVERAVASAIAETGASSVRDMGRVMAHLKARHTGQMDFARAGAAVKEAFR
ncbi:GatB/YqeY domain-containing protein [Amaricoccus solimangrovi]|uniref:GatB/YqeY domain-containing protein n=1 Tax=Amaricoccus solimangrovi TaxID=2589815 RepID=A0A501WYJ9_9RHOB|nr:GatB/YqeY domain-containing protein [Amaricoccus solimangrovi]TPE53700.1 GatB/YqeY domain-containing protein [Amaricoccus solimangrovi]